MDVEVDRVNIRELQVVHSALFIYVAVLLTLCTGAYVVDVFLRNRRRTRQALLDVG